MAGPTPPGAAGLADAASPTRKARRRGEAALDAWTWVHVGSGAALGALLGSWWLALLLLLLYEAFEAGLRRIRLQDGGLFEYESWPNIGADVVAGLLGFAAMRLLLQAAGW